MGQADSIIFTHFKLYVLYQTDVRENTWNRKMLPTMAEYDLSSLSHRFRMKTAAVVTQTKNVRFYFKIIKYLPSPFSSPYPFTTFR